MKNCSFLKEVGLHRILESIPKNCLGPIIQFAFISSRSLSTMCGFWVTFSRECVRSALVFCTAVWSLLLSWQSSCGSSLIRWSSLSQDSLCCWPWVAVSETQSLSENCRVKNLQANGRSPLSWDGIPVYLMTILSEHFWSLCVYTYRYEENDTLGLYIYIYKGSMWSLAK